MIKMTVNPMFVTIKKNTRVPTSTNLDRGDFTYVARIRNIRNKYIKRCTDIYSLNTKCNVASF